MTERSEKQEWTIHFYYLLGQAIGTENAAGHLRVRAGEFFTRGEDDKAKLWRSIADDLDRRGEKLRDEWEEHKAKEPSDD